MFAFDLATGRKVWAVSVPDAGNIQDPVVAGGVLCVVGGTAGVAGFRLR